MKTSLSSSSESQLKFLDDVVKISRVPYFKDMLEDSGIPIFKPVGLDIFQVNICRLCNQICKHCHVNAGPGRTEMMSKENLQICLNIIYKYNIPVVDITGGAPEMNPYFRWFVEECRKLNKKIIVRCNLTVILEDKNSYDLPDFYALNKVEIVASLPCYTADNTDRVRGNGVFNKSIEVLKLLNNKGYGKPYNSLILNLVYNPSGAFLPVKQDQLEKDYKKELKQKFNIDFTKLYVITNMPVGRFHDYLMSSNNYVSYLENLVNAFNPMAAKGTMCLNMISVSWDGYIYDCDFNQILDMKIYNGINAHISEFELQMILNREVRVSQHCYGCTAGGGSSCNGETY